MSVPSHVQIKTLLERNRELEQTVTRLAVAFGKCTIEKLELQQKLEALEGHPRRAHTSHHNHQRKSHGR